LIELEDGYPVAKFLEEVYEKNKLLLEELALAKFTVFSNRESIKKDERLRNYTEISGLGGDGRNPLLVMVPSD
jgi:hypothetical protein